MSQMDLGRRSAYVTHPQVRRRRSAADRAPSAGTLSPEAHDTGADPEHRHHSPGIGHEFGALSVHDRGGHGSDHAGGVTMQPQSASAEEGIEVGDDLMLLPSWTVTQAPTGGLQRQAAASTDACETPSGMRKVISGPFEGGKTLDDYFPDIVGTRSWGSNKSAGPFDNGFRAGSSVQLIGEYPSPCLSGGKPFTLGQMATIKRMRGDGKKLLEKGKPLEGQTLDDIRRSGRDQSKPPFRQEFGFAVTMADPISGAPYSSFGSYELDVNLRASLTGLGGTQTVDWGVTVESQKGAVTKNEVR